MRFASVRTLASQSKKLCPPSQALWLPGNARSWSIAYHYCEGCVIQLSKLEAARSRRSEFARERGF